MPSPSYATPSRVAVTLLLLGASVLTACSKQNAAPLQRGAVPVTVVTLQASSVTLTRELPGRVTPYLVAEVRPQVTGIVAKRLFDEGGTVRAGQPLYQLDDALYQAEHASAQAALARAEATLNTAELEARRSAGLVEIKAVSQQEDENARAALMQSKADVAAARAALQRTAVTLGYARIKSPIGGRIGKSSVTQGALVTENQAEPLATVQQLDPVYVDLTQSSAELLNLRQSLATGRLESANDVPVTIALEDGTTYAHAGKLEFSDVSVDPTTGSYLLRVVVPNPEQVLLPGTYVRARIGTGLRNDALLVPQQGVARDARGGTTVMLVNAEGQVEARPVQVSRVVGDRWLVEEGLAAGDRVIVEGLQKIRPGDSVQASEAGATAAAPAPAPAPQS
jgi:membrane fusion protein (multidrug efflux system)